MFFPHTDTGTETYKFMGKFGMTIGNTFYCRKLILPPIESSRRALQDDVLSFLIIECLRGQNPKDNY